MAQPTDETASAEEGLQQLTSSESLQGVFYQQKTLRELPFPLISSGEFRFTRTEGLIWHIKQPIDNQIHITSSGISSWQDGKNVVNISAKGQPLVDVVSRIFFSLVSGDQQALEQYFNIDHSNPDSGWQLNLTPRNEQIARFATGITLRGDEFIAELILQEPGGDTTEIRFDQVSR